MSVSKRDFEAIAEGMREEIAHTRALRDLGHLSIEAKVERDLAAIGVAHRISVYFKTQNPRFDRERFLEACGVKGL